MTIYRAQQKANKRVDANRLNAQNRGDYEH